MLVKDIVEILGARMPVAHDGAGDIEIAGISYHSARARQGDLFAALPGTRDDGTRHIAEALSKGAGTILYPVGARGSLGEPPPGTAFLGVEDVRLALALSADLFFGRPSRQMTVIGVTGTNGKTTLTYLVESMAREAELACGVIGTIHYRLGGRVIPAERTTPESPDLQATLRWMADEGAKLVVMEVSSHALAQRRVDGTRISYALFTNLSLDHLDYHGDMEAYYQAKKRLFTDFDLQAAIINLDDPWGRRLASETGVEVISFGHLPECHIRPQEASLSETGLKMVLEVPGGVFHLTSALLGKHNAQNVMAAAALGWRMGLPAEAIRDGIAQMREVPGRFQKVSAPGGPLVAVDYAHTPDALQKLLESARKLTTGRLILVFGCGGDRDRGKRPLMGEVAAVGADLSLITSDNPRSEPPGSIIEAIVEGYRKVRTDGYRVVPDRRQAIFEAVSGATPADTVVIAGKGHETCQILGTRKVHFDDREVAREALAAGREN